MSNTLSEKIRYSKSYLDTDDDTPDVTLELWEAEKVNSELTTLCAKLEKAREALRPFAEMYNDFDDAEPDQYISCRDKDGNPVIGCRLKDLRNAASTLKEISDE